MDRRRFVGFACCSFIPGFAGCFSEREPVPDPKLALLELENHRREASYEFSVRIESETTVDFEKTHTLGPAGSGNDAIVFEDPVEAGTYTVRVTVGEHSATAEIQDLISDEQQCLRLQFYLGDETLHLEQYLYDRCE